MNKQSSVKMLWMEIDNLIPYTNERDSQLFRDLLEKYEAIHKEDIIQSNRDGVDMCVSNGKFITGEQYYNEKFGGNK